MGPVWEPGPGSSPGVTAAIGSQFNATSVTGTQDTGQGPRSSLPATKPARAVIDVLVVVEDPWIYSARESNTSSQTAPDWDQPAAGDRSRATSGGPVSGRPRERRLLPANSK